MANVLERGAKARKLRLIDLPDGVLEKIIEYVPLKAKLSLRLTCRQLAAEVLRKVEFHPLLTDESVDPILDIRKEIKHRIGGFRCADLTMPDFSPTVVSEFAPQITKLSILDAQYKKETISSNNLYQMFHMFPNVTQLELTGKIMSEGIGIKPQEFRETKLDNLLVLKLSFTGPRANFHGLRAIELAKFPKLKELDVFVHTDHLRLNWEDWDSLCFLIGSHATTLKHLKFNDQAFWSDEVDNIPSDRMPDILLLLGQVQLESLELSNPVFDRTKVCPAGKSVFLGSLIQNQRLLKVITVNFPKDFPLLREEILEAIKKSSSTLESITYKHCRMDRILQVDMSHFPCPNLKKFSITTPVPVLNLHLIPNSIKYLVWDWPITMNEVSVLRLHLPNLIEVEFGTLAEYRTYEIITGIFENHKTKRIIGHIQRSPSSYLLGPRVVIPRDIQFPEIPDQPAFETYLSSCLYSINNFTN